MPISKRSNTYQYTALDNDANVLAWYNINGERIGLESLKHDRRVLKQLPEAILEYLDD